MTQHLYSLQDLPLLGVCHSVVERHFRVPEVINGIATSKVETFHIFYGHGLPAADIGSPGNILGFVISWMK
jgi:hypothetical protein